MSYFLSSPLISPPPYVTKHSLKINGAPLKWSQVSCTFLRCSVFNAALYFLCYKLTTANLDEFLFYALALGELELPFMALVLVIVAPNQVMNLRWVKSSFLLAEPYVGLVVVFLFSHLYDVMYRGMQEGAIIAVLIAVYLGFQHFSRTSLQKSLEQGSIVATVAIICIVVASLLFLIWISWERLQTDTSCVVLCRS